VGYFGSYARAEHGVGSDVDILVLVNASARPFTERALDFDATRLPVPADVLVYTLPEWEAVAAAGNRFAQRLRREVVWVLGDGGELFDVRRSPGASAPGAVADVGAGAGPAAAPPHRARRDTRDHG
jgi:predicted nucleotidyltransferase